MGNVNAPQTAITKKLADKVLSVVDVGLCSGLGDAQPGEMCVEAAVCYAMGLPHSDNPPCVNPAVRALKIRLNDSGWSSKEARAKGMRRIAIAQLGTVEWDLTKTVKFAQKCAELAMKVAADAADAADDAADDAAVDAARAATYASWAADDAAAYADDDAARAAARAATNASWAASDAADAAYATGDKVLSDFAESVVQILIELKSPGTEFIPPL